MNEEEFKKFVPEAMQSIASKITREELDLVNLIINKFNDVCFENMQLQNNWNELKEFVEKDIKRWEDEEKKWIEQGFMKFGGEANNKIIFKKVLNKMQELQGDDKN